MPSEWDGFLEELARALHNQGASEDWLKMVLRDKLLPLLEAGQAMRMNIGAYAVALNANPFKQEDTSRAIRGCVDGLQAWDAALKGSTKCEQLKKTN